MSEINFYIYIYIYIILKYVLKNWSLTFMKKICTLQQIIMKNIMGSCMFTIRGSFPSIKGDFWVKKLALDLFPIFTKKEKKGKKAKRRGNSMGKERKVPMKINVMGFYESPNPKPRVKGIMIILHVKYENQTHEWP